MASLILVANLTDVCGISYVLPVLNCDMPLTSQQKGILGGIGLFGVSCSLYFWGYLADTMGRKRIIHPTLLFAFIASFLSTFIVNFYLFAFLRFINGILWVIILLKYCRLSFTFFLESLKDYIFNVFLIPPLSLCLSRYFSVAWPHRPLQLLPTWENFTMPNTVAEHSWAAWPSLASYAYSYQYLHSSSSIKIGNLKFPCSIWHTNHGDFSSFCVVSPE